VQFSGIDYVHNVRQQSPLFVSRTFLIILNRSMSSTLVTITLLSVSISLPIPGISHKYNHTVVVLLGLVSFTLHKSSKFLYVVECIQISLLLWLNNIPLCVYYIFFSWSSVDGHLSCFYLLNIVDNAAINFGVLDMFEFLFFSSYGYIPRIKIAG
jgi:hypothetical protein